LALADSTSWQFTLALVIFTGIAGASLARWQGWKTYARIQEELAAKRMPADSLADAGMILVASAFLLTPGMLTDLFGFSLLIPPLRAIYRRSLKKYFKRRFPVRTAEGFAPSSQPNGDRVIDSYVVRREGNEEGDDDYHRSSPTTRRGS